MKKTFKDLLEKLENLDIQDDELTEAKQELVRYTLVELLGMVESESELETLLGFEMNTEIDPDQFFNALDKLIPNLEQQLQEQLNRISQEFEKQVNRAQIEILELDLELAETLEEEQVLQQQINKLKEFTQDPVFTSSS